MTEHHPGGGIRVAVADDQSLYREGLCTLLSTFADFQVVGQAENGRDAVAVALQYAPAVMLMDLRMPVLDGVQATRRLRAEAPNTRVVVLTTFDDDESIFDAIRAGALGYLLKDTPSAELAEAVRQAARGASFLTPRVATRLVERVARGGQDAPGTVSALVSELTNREREILALLGRGATNKDIARTLAVTEGTVKNHVTSIFSKLGVGDRLQAALLARDSGLTR